MITPGRRLLIGLCVFHGGVKTDKPWFGGAQGRDASNDLPTQTNGSGIFHRKTQSGEVVWIIHIFSLREVFLLFK